MIRRRARPGIALIGWLCFHGIIVYPNISIFDNVNTFVSASRNNSPFVRNANTFGFLVIRGGDDNTDVVESSTSTEKNDNVEVTFEDKVQNAMRKFGIKRFKTKPSEEEPKSDESNPNCEGGVCKPPSTATGDDENKKEENSENELPESKESMEDIAKRLASDFEIDESIAMSALQASATIISPSEKNDNLTNIIPNEEKAREILQYEIDATKKIVPDDSEEVELLVKEGFESKMVKRALVLTDMNIDDARAVLIAEQEDELAEQELANQQKEEEQPPIEAIAINSNFDPTAATAPATPSTPKPPSKPEIYKCTTAEIQSIVLESKIPVLIDVYADWCGPCKQLTPALEEMCTKSNGLFRLVKINADEEKGLVSSVLSVTGYPTLFGVRDGKIINRSVGSPNSEEAFRSFMMEMVSGHDKDGEFEEMTTKLVKMAGSAALPFSQRERIQTLTQSHLSQLLKTDCENDMFKAEKCVKLIRTLLSKVIQEPYDLKYRKINLSHPALQLLNSCPASLRILKNASFQKAIDSPTSWTLKENQKVINIAPLFVVRDGLDKWMDVNRYEIAKAARKAKEDKDRVKLQEELEAQQDDDQYDEEDEEEEEEVDPNMCMLKLRLDGKKKIHDMTFNGDDSMKQVMDEIKNKILDSTDTEQDIQLICASKRLILKPSDNNMMEKSLRDLGLFPSASLVLKIIKESVVEQVNEEEIIVDEEGKQNNKSSIAERAKARKKKTGSHTMQSTGIYAKDDNNKMELIDGGGGVWYEHDVTDDEEEADEPDEADEIVADEEADEADDIIAHDEADEADEVLTDDEYDENEEEEDDGEDESI